jgi:hypothetical protein
MLLITPMLPLSAPLKARLEKALAWRLSGVVAYEHLPEHKSPKRFRQGKTVHGERKTEQAGQDHGFPANMVREPTPMEDRARFRYEEQGLLETK